RRRGGPMPSSRRCLRPAPAPRAAIRATKPSQTTAVPDLPLLSKQSHRNHFPKPKKPSPLSKTQLSPHNSKLFLTKQSHQSCPPTPAPLSRILAMLLFLSLWIIFPRISHRRAAAKIVLPLRRPPHP